MADTTGVRKVEVAGAFAAHAKIGGHSTDYYMVRPRYPNKLEPYEGRNKCVLGISVGNASHIDKKLEAIVNWAVECFGPDNVIINISDTLHRHNLLKVANSMGIATEMAAAFGKGWLEENRELLARKGIRTKNILRWKDSINDPEFPNRMLVLGALEQTDPTFVAAIEKDIETFLGRAIREGLKGNELFAARKASRAYILEEIAGYSCLLENYRACRAYPGDILHSFKYFKDVPFETRNPLFDAIRDTPFVTLKLDHKDNAPDRNPANDSNRPPVAVAN